MASFGLTDHSPAANGARDHSHFRKRKYKTVNNSPTMNIAGRKLNRFCRPPAHGKPRICGAGASAALTKQVDFVRRIKTRDKTNLQGDIGRRRGARFNLASHPEVPERGLEPPHPCCINNHGNFGTIFYYPISIICTKVQIIY
ncbi:MAG TPA: hypothetical protein VFE46_01040 [Pirellulales bacterium]|nr:hypothetical protein [Pirellulales bacterium]